jgi:Amino acid synthesis
MQEAVDGGATTLGRPHSERSLAEPRPVVPAPAEAAEDQVDSLVRVGIRKVVLYREAVLSENGRAPARPGERATAAAVLANPWVGTGPETDLSPEVAVIAPVLARLLTGRLIGALGGVDRIEAFGKAAVVGTAGEIEHAGALIHTPYFGNLMRDFLEGESIICFADTRADAGEALVVPMWHKTHAATRSHYQTITARVPDAPRADELVVIAAASTGPRPHARIGDRATDPVVTAENLGVR